MRGGEYLDDPIVPSASGRAGSPIVYTAYQTERPVLTSNRVLGLADAILLRNISYVVVQRVAVDGRAPAPQATVAHFATLDGATYIEIRDCDFKHADGWTGISIYGEAHRDLIVRNRIDFVGSYVRDGDDFGDSIWIDSAAHHNLVASNYLTHGGHELLRSKGYNNIVQDNAFDNDWSDVLGADWGTKRYDRRVSERIPAQHFARHQEIHRLTMESSYESRR